MGSHSSTGLRLRPSHRGDRTRNLVRIVEPAALTAVLIRIVRHWESPMSDIDNRLRAPIRYSPSVERPDADEAETTEGLIATIKYITDKTLADCGHALRGVHAKSHGILEGYL